MGIHLGGFYLMLMYIYIYSNDAFLWLKIVKSYQKMGINKNGGRFFNVNVYVFTPMMHFYD